MENSFMGSVTGNKQSMEAILTRRGLSLSTYKLLASLAIAGQVLAFACIQPMADYSQMAGASILQLVLLVVVLSFSPCRQSFCILFLVVDWIFHCGQIACIAAGQYDSLNLDFRWYVSPSVAGQAFEFYFFAQSLVALGAVLFQKRATIGSPKRPLISVNRSVALALVAVGAPFRLYVDAARLMGAYSSGYEGVYSLVIPSIFQAAAFFFDAGALMLLLLYGRDRKGVTIFWCVFAYKLVVMSAGARQEAFCFVLVWCFLYFGYIRKLSVGRIIALLAGAVVLLYAVDGFGELRTQGFSFSAFQTYLSGQTPFDVVWDSLGEFGCAFTTLAVAIGGVPSLLDYGMGGSYIAGVLSVVPTLVGHFPGLKETTIFTTSLPNTDFFGGSMLGEFYYNFGWFGLVGCFLVGGVVSACQNGLNNFSAGRVDANVWIAAVLSVFMLLYVRGYFTDAMMKLVYVMLLAWVATGFAEHAHERTATKTSIAGDRK